MDSIGAMKHVTAATVLGAVGLARQGRIYALAQVFDPAMPQLADCPDINTDNRLAVKVHDSARPDFDTHVFAEWVGFDTHCGTHIDAFAHWAKGGRMYGGLDPAKVYDEGGMKHLGLDEAPPIFTRGVLIDVAGYRGQDVLPVGTVIQPDDLRGALDRQGVSLEKGSAALVRTGWARNWGDPRAYMSHAPGLSRSAAEWVAEQGCVALGADQWMVDAYPPERLEDRRACHEVCLVDYGVFIIENLNLEQLAQDGVSEFLFVALAPPLKGGTAFPCQALAIV
jgi:kynurenine formamidase